MAEDFLKAILGFTIVIFLMYLFTVVYGGPFSPFFVFVAEYLPRSVDQALRMPGYMH